MEWRIKFWGRLLRSLDISQLYLGEEIRSAFQKDDFNSDLFHTYLNGKSTALFVMLLLVKMQTQPLSKSVFHHCFQTLLTIFLFFFLCNPSTIEDYSRGKRKNTSIPSKTGAFLWTTISFRCIIILAYMYMGFSLLYLYALLP